MNQSAQCREVEIGVKMKIEKGPAIIGMDQLRELLNDGYEITDISDAAVTMEKTGESDGHVSMYFSGGVFKVTLKKSWLRKMLRKLNGTF